MYENIQTHNVPVANERGLSSGPAGSSLSRPGGVLQYDVTPTDTGSVGGNYRSPAIQANPESVNTFTVGQGNVRQPMSGVTTVSSAELTGGQTGILSTAVNAWGNAARGNLTPDCTVKYGGMEVTLETLESIGVIRRDNNGQYVESSGGQSGTVPFTGELNKAHGDLVEGIQEELPEGVELFDDANESALAEAIAPVPQPLYDKALVNVIEKGIDETNWTELAFHSGMSVAEAKHRASMIDQAFTNQMAGIAQTMGVHDLNHAFQWATANKPEELATARREMAMTRNTTALRSLVSSYLGTAAFNSTVPSSVQSLQNLGVNSRTDSNGNPLIKIGGSWMSPAEAVRRNLL